MFDLLPRFPSLLLCRLCFGALFLSVEAVGGLLVEVSCSFCRYFASRFVPVSLLLLSSFGSALRFGCCLRLFWSVSLSLISGSVTLSADGRLPPLFAYP